MATRRSELQRRLAETARNFVSLAHRYDRTKHGDCIGWIVSEKLDGVRARFYNGRLLSRSKREFPCPKWFLDKITEAVGMLPVDGELYCGRGQFQKTVSIVRNGTTDNWSEVKYVIFDLVSEKPYIERIKKLRSSVKINKHVDIINTDRISKDKNIDYWLNEFTINVPGEGIIIRDPESPYIFGRSKSILKVKPIESVEVEVIGIEEGHGRNEGVMGALICKLGNMKFRVGTGFSDEDRKNPPPIGSKITIEYYDTTDSGVPRFPVFVAVRDYE